MEQAQRPPAALKETVSFRFVVEKRDLCTLLEAPLMPLIASAAVTFAAAVPAAAAAAASACVKSDDGQYVQGLCQVHGVLKNSEKVFIEACPLARV